MKTSKFKMTEIGEIPADWEVKRFDDTFEHVSSKLFQIQSSECQEGGRFEVVDQGQKEIVGYTDDEKKLFHVPSGGIIIFGDHTRIIKFRESDFVVGADGTQLLAGKEDFTRFLFYVLQQLDIPNLGYSRHFKYLKEGRYVIPSSHLEQKAIVEALSDVDALIVAQEELIEKKRAIKQGAMQELLTGKKRLVGFKNSESSCLCASVLKKDAGVVEGDFNTETQRRRGTEFKMTEIGLIPEDWEVKRLGDLCETSSGGTPSRSNLNYYNGDIKWFTTTELQDCNLYDSNEHISSEALKNSSAKIFPRGTLLMAMYGATIGRLGVLRTEATTNQACCAIFCGNLIDTAYTYYYLYYSRSAIIEKGCGAGQPNVSQEIVRSLWLPVPSLPEQRAIAEVLSDMDAEIEALEARRAKYESIKQGMMQELLTGKTRLKGA